MIILIRVNVKQVRISILLTGQRSISTQLWDTIITKRAETSHHPGWVSLSNLTEHHLTEVRKGDMSLDNWHKKISKNCMTLCMRIQDCHRSPCMMNSLRVGKDVIQVKSSLFVLRKVRLKKLYEKWGSLIHHRYWKATGQVNRKDHTLL